MQTTSKSVKPVLQSANEQDSPYVGPRPFTLQDQDVFFGRTQETIELTALVKAHPEVLLYAPSGAGKTSLLFAKVLPALNEEEEFDVLPVARVRSQEASTIPETKIRNIYMFNALKDLANNQLRLMERAQLTLADYLARRARPLLNSNGSEAPHDRERCLARVIIFDQFEEIFTLYPERYKDRQEFFSQVADALKADPFLRVIFSMREDYIAELEPYISVLPQYLRTRYRLERLRELSALSAVKSPLQAERFKKTGRYFAEGAAELLVKRLMLIKVKTASGEKIEAPGEFVDPVQLQVVCQTFWEKLPRAKTAITKTDVDKYANVDEALSDFYENCIRTAIKSANTALAASGSESLSEGVVRNWFEQKLITREGKRNIIFREHEMTGGLTNLMVDELENQHVIRAEMRGGEPWYELSHDRFIAPIRESNRRFLLQQPVARRKGQELEARARQWFDSGRSDSLLLNRGELADAQNWLRMEGAAIGYSETLYSFIQASESVIEHEDRQRQQLLTDEQQRRIVAERQRGRLLKLGFVAVSVLLVFVVGSAFSAFKSAKRATVALGEATIQKKNAESAADKLAMQKRTLEEQANKLKTANVDLQTAKDNLQAAKDNLEDANDKLAIQKQEADDARGRAETARAFADVQRRAADSANEELCAFTKNLEQSRNNGWSLKLAADADSVLKDDPQKSLALAILATDRSETDEAKVALRHSFMKAKEHAVLRGHENIVEQAAYGANGQIYTISDDGRIGIWDAQTNAIVKMLPTGAPAVHALAISRDGNWLVTEENNSKGRIWNLRDYSFKELQDLTGPVAAVALSPDSRLVATEATEEGAGRDKAGAAPRIWDVSTGTPLTTLLGHEKAVAAIAFSPLGDKVATASWDGTGRIWEVKSGKTTAILQGHTAPLTSIAFDRTGQLVVTGSYDGTARIWDVTTGKETFVLKGHTGVVQSAVFSPNNDYVLTSGKELLDKPRGFDQSVPLSPELQSRLGTPDNTARLWNAHTGKLLGVLRRHTGDVNSASFSSDSRYIVTAGEDGVVAVWNANNLTLVNEFDEHTRSVNSAVFSADNMSILTASSDRTAQMWHWTGSARLQFEPHKRAVLGTTIMPDGSLVTSGRDGKVRVWTLDAQSGQPEPQSGGVDINLGLLSTDPIGGVPLGVYDLAVSPRGDLAVTGSLTPVGPVSSAATDRTAHIWNVSARKFEDRKLQGHTEPVVKVLFSSSGRYLATMSAKQVQVWDTSTWTPVSLPGTDEAPILNVAFTPDDETLLMVQRDGTLTRRRKSGEIETAVLLPTIRRAVFDQQGTLIAALVAADSSVGIWNVNGIKKASISDAGYADTLAFNSDSRLLLTSGFTTSLNVWQTDTGEGVAEYDQFHDSFTSLGFDDLQRLIVAGDSRGRVSVIECELCRPFADVKKLAKENNRRPLTQKELDKYLPGEKQEFSPTQCAGANKPVPVPH